MPPKRKQTKQVCFQFFISEHTRSRFFLLEINLTAFKTRFWKKKSQSLVLSSCSESKSGSVWIHEASPSTNHIWRKCYNSNENPMSIKKMLIQVPHKVTPYTNATPKKANQISLLSIFHFWTSAISNFFIGNRSNSIQITFLKTKIVIPYVE